MSENKKNFFAGIFFLIFGIFIFVNSFSLPTSTADPLGPAGVPRLISSLMVILAVILMIQGLKGMKEEGRVPNAPFVFNNRLVLTIAILVIYFLFIRKIGFVVLTACYLFCQILLLLPSGSIRNAKRMVTTILISVITPLFIYLLFSRMFNIFLPKGIVTFL